MPARPERSTFRTMLAVCAIALVIAFVSSTLVLAKSPALPSWSDTATTAAIEDFVTRVTTEGSTDFVPVADRIAVFDMDGTLIVEKPLPAALAPIVDGIKAAVSNDPAIAERPAISAFLKGDTKALAAAGEAGFVEIASTALAGRTLDQAAADLRKQMFSADGKLTGVKPYQPMRELIDYLEANDFEVWICSGSPVLFTRAFSDEAFGIPVERVMGTTLVTKFTERDGKSQLVIGDSVSHINDKEGKPPTINQAVGKRPLLVGGNVLSGGDIAMMRYSRDRDGPSLQLLINHDDAAREFAYAEPDNFSLGAAERYGFHVVSIKNDWATVFAP
jgi:phosphoserine phosphatase